MKTLCRSAMLRLLVFASLSQWLYGQASDARESITAGDLALSFDQNGAITHLVDAGNGTDYSVKSDHSSLVGLVTGAGKILNPDGFTFKDGRCHYQFAKGISVEVKAETTPAYITFEVIDFQNDTQQDHLYVRQVAPRRP